MVTIIHDWAARTGILERAGPARRALLAYGVLRVLSGQQNIRARTHAPHWRQCPRRPLPATGAREGDV